MGESNGHWGGLAAHDDELAEVYDGFDLLPEAGVNDVLDAFCAAKRITIPALVRLGTRLADYRVLAFPYDGGIKYRDMESGRRWSATDSVFGQLKLVRAGAERSDTVIIAEGETDGARLTLLYPQVDVAVLPAGAKKWTAAFAEQLEPYARVLVGADNDAAGEECHALVLATIPTAERFAPPASNDWCAHDGDPPPLPVPPEPPDHAGPIIFADVLPAYRGELPVPKVIVDDLLYDQGVHWISGEPGSGKSLIAAMLSNAVMYDRRHVVWLDWEQGLRMTGQRLREMDVPEAVIVEYFHYAFYPPEPEKHLAAIAERYPNALVVVDSVSKALSQQGIDENSATEVTAWTTRLIQGTRNYGMPLIAIDHISKSKEAQRSDYARGSGAKQADTDVHWRVEKLSPLSRTQAGVVKLSNKKDKDGYLPTEYPQFFKIGDGAGNLPIVPTEDPEAEVSGDDEPTI